MVDLANVHPIIGRLRLALANGRGLQANAEDVIALAAAVGLAANRGRTSGQRLEAAAARLPTVECLHQYRHNAGGVSPARYDVVMSGEHASALAELALAVLGEL